MLRLIYCYPGEEEVITDPVSDKVAAAMAVSPWVGCFDDFELEGDPHHMLHFSQPGENPETPVPGGSLYMGNPKVHQTNEEIISESDASLAPQQLALET